MRHLIILILALALMPSMGTADSMYKWVDAQGNVHYSDKPAPGATKIDVPKVSTFTPPQPVAPPCVECKRFRPDGAPTDANSATTGYTAITISAPTDQETLWNVPSVTVSVDVKPALQPGDSVTITLDGASKVVNGTSATFDDVDRGQHTITASVGGVNAPPVTFFIQKTSSQKPPAH
jgi:hypothetical protein